MKSLRLQVIAAILAVLGLGLTSLLIIAGSRMAQMATEAFISQQEVETLTIANVLGASVGDLRQNQVDPQAFISRASAQSNTDLTIISPTGNVIATTYDQSPALTGAPELLKALDGQVLTSSIRDGNLFIASPILHDNHILIGVVWMDASLAPVEAELRERWITLIAATAGVLVFACAVGWWLSARIVRPLAAIQVVAEQMAGGQLDVRATVSNTSDELVSLELAFNRMADRVESMLAKQTEFVANASHELRSPLASIRLRAEALASDAVRGERAHQYAAEINSEVERLARLVTDLLQLSRADSGTFTPPSQAINVTDELMACARAIRPRLAEKKQQFESNIAEDIPELYIYPTDLRIMVNNLLDNAIKYTPEAGCVALSASWKDEKLVIEVSDTGEGIPPEDIPRVTDRFFRVDRAHTRSAAGTGLGLALALATVKQYNGFLTITSEGISGKGTRARLELSPAHTQLFKEKLMER